MAIEDDGLFGYGCMRLPLHTQEDQTSFHKEKICQLFDRYLSYGFTYFDTAYIYHNYKSELAVRDCLVRRHPRDQFRLATKMPLRDLSGAEDVAVKFHEQLEKCDVTFFDYYLLHNVGRHVMGKIRDYQIFDFTDRMKKEGKIRHLGISCHDTAEFLEDFLKEYGEHLDFVQLQINYLDMDQMNIQGRLCLEVANRYHLPVIVMEPCKGGTLIHLPEEAENLLKSYAPERSIASWAMRFAASQPGVVRVLSGMNEWEQVEDNCTTLRDFEPITQEEQQLLDQVVAILRKQLTIQCTGCEYCTHGCPKEIPIPLYFASYNSIQKDTGAALGQYLLYNNVVNNGRGKASDCIQCGLCEKACPQHLTIREYLKQVTDMYENGGWKKKRWLGAAPKED